MFVHQKANWSVFKWDNDKIIPLLGNVRYLQGKLLGQMDLFIPFKGFV
jgi:hypothetical protein